MSDFPVGRLASGQVYPGLDTPDRARTDLLPCAHCEEMTAPENLTLIEGKRYCDFCYTEAL